MDSSFVTNLRKITDDDERIVTITLLIDIISNLLSDKSNRRHHTLPNSYVQEMFHKYQGAMQCLQLIGFQQVNNDYVFNQTTITNGKLEEIQKLLENELDPNVCNEKMKCCSIDLGIIDEQMNSISFPNIRIPSVFQQKIPFLSTINLVQSYEDKTLREHILSSIIPIEDFHRKIANRNLNKRDLLLFELLKWFKEEFFTWFDRGYCQQCRKSMDMVGYTQPTRDEQQIGDAHRVELYRCSTCSTEFRFPRFNAIRKLLETRSGRCGEAANLFTCLCRALSFRARYIHDTTDHVWTEVYSESEHRWLHCDACENLCDSPLVYEKGWKKKLIFCTAFAKDHIQDVTWRYVSDFKQTKLRRNINENKYAKVIHQVNQHIQTQFSQQEKQQIRSRQIEDLVSMIVEQKATKESELHGRQSGSLAWKLSRGETDEDDVTNGFIFEINQQECEHGSILIEYNSVKNVYYRNQIEENKKNGWIDRVNSCSNVQRKVERDWKMTYLSRKYLNSDGIIAWSFQLKPELAKSYRFHQIQIQCPSTTFDQHAKVRCQLQIANQQSIDLYQNNLHSNSMFEYTFNGNDESIEDCRLIFKIILSSTNDSNDENAWQKAQLFRQSIEQTSDEDHSHFLSIGLTMTPRH